MQATDTASSLSKSDREQMLASVEKMICKAVVNSSIPERERDDARQAARMELWKASGRFDPNGKAKWSTLAGSIIPKVLSSFRDKLPLARPRADYPNELGETAERHTDTDEPTPEDVRDLHAAVRRTLFADALSALDSPTGKMRQVVEAIVVRGLTADQYALQTGQELKMVVLTLRSAIGKLAMAGVVPPGSAERYGTSPLMRGRQFAKNSHDAEDKRTGRSDSTPGFSLKQLSDLSGIPEDAVMKLVNALGVTGSAPTAPASSAASAA